MSPRRFSASQRAALYIAADGRCARCGRRLLAGWHSDHILPWSLGGATDVANGQALCPTCNVLKGADVMPELRAWQRQAINGFFAKASTDFLVSATPGSGKTMFACTLVRRVFDERTAQRVVVIVPTDALRQQWADAAAAFGLSLMPVSRPEDYDKPGYDGCVATYSQVARGAGSDLVRRACRVPTVAVLDEVHHAGENRSWGDGLTYALEGAVHRLALTGTPWRLNPDEPIPFVAYDGSGLVVVDYPYEYGAAVADGVCRSIIFDAYEGEGRWRDCGVIESAALGADLDDDKVSALLETVYHPDNEWMPSVLRAADTTLDEVRQEVPDAAGLVVANQRWQAHRYADLIHGLTGTRPAVVTSEDPEAKAKLDRFRDGTDRWLVAVKMVSEGVDIPRLIVGVYASKTKTPLFFRQVVGRFVRTRVGEEVTARLFIPAIPALMEHARAIEEELRHQLDLETERYEKERAEARSEQRILDLREPLSASEAVFDRSIFSGDEVSPDERLRAEAECRRVGIPAQYAVQVARMMREAGPVVTGVAVEPRPSPEPRHRRERVLRGEVEKLARSLARRTGIEVREVNGDMLRRGFPRRASATVEQLEVMREFLAERLGDL